MVARIGLVLGAVAITLVATIPAMASGPTSHFKAPCAAGQYRAEYFANKVLSGIPSAARCEPQINNDWGWGTPSEAGVGVDDFSARWTGKHAFEAGEYDFSATADDGVRIYVDGSLVVDGWKDQVATTYEATRAMTAGEHEVKVEYYERGGQAVAKASWQKTSEGRGGETGTNPFVGAKFWVDPNSNAKKQADLWRQDRPEDAAQMDKIAAQPQAIWLGYSHDTVAKVSAVLDPIYASGATPVIVIHNMYLDYMTTYSGYEAFIQRVKSGINGRKAIIILEPDALARTPGGYSSTVEQQRYTLLKNAITTLQSAPGTSVYLDAGNPGWWPASGMAELLKKAGIESAKGFSVNVSNFHYTKDSPDLSNFPDSTLYGKDVSALVGGKHFVIDTGRNGLGPHPDWRDASTQYSWCNPPERALGERPTANTGDALVDAYYWFKPPGESDNPCNGGGPAGEWWPEYALGLAQRAAY